MQEYLPVDPGYQQVWKKDIYKVRAKDDGGLVLIGHEDRV